MFHFESAQCTPESLFQRRATKRHRNNNNSNPVCSLISQFQLPATAVWLKQGRKTLSPNTYIITLKGIVFCD